MTDPTPPLTRYAMTQDDVDAIRAAMATCDGEWGILVRTGDDWSTKKGNAVVWLDHSDAAPREACEGVAAGLFYGRSVTQLAQPYVPVERVGLTRLDLSWCKSLTDVSGLSGLTGLTESDLSGCELLTDMSGLSSLTGLTRLDLSWCESLTEVSGLSGLTGLTELNLSECSRLTEVSGLSGLTGLTELNLSECSRLTEVSGLSGLTGLTRLDLSWCRSLTDVSVLSGLTGLTELDLGGCSSLTDVSVVSGLTGLTELNLSDCISLTDVSVVSGLTGLVSLVMRRCDSLTDVSGLSGLTGLTELKLSECSRLTEVSGLSGLTGLTELNLSECSRLTDVSGLSGLTGLVSLVMRRCDSLTEVSGLSGLTSLTILDLFGCSRLTDVSVLSGLTGLTWLDLSWCKSLTDVSVVSGLTGLTRLYLGGCSSLTDVSVLSGLTGLTELDLGGCSSLTDVSGLSGLTGLTELNLERCQSLTDVSVLSGLTGLTELNLSNCISLTDVSGLAGLTGLTHVKVRDCKRLTKVAPLLALPVLESLDLGGSGAIRDLDRLKDCPALRKLSWTEEAACHAVLAATAVLREDAAHVADQVSAWLASMPLSKVPDTFAGRLVKALALPGLADATVLTHLAALAEATRARALADEGQENPVSTDTWTAWTRAVLDRGDPGLRAPVEAALTDLHPQREVAAVLTPVLTVLSELPARYPEARDWAVGLVTATLQPLSTDADVARAAAPAAAVFYAAFGDDDAVRRWLDHGTHPHSPRWRDRVLAALVGWAASRGEVSRARRWLDDIETSEVRDTARASLARALASSAPDAAVADLEAIEDAAIRAGVAADLAQVSAVTGTAEGVYGVLLCLQDNDAALADLLGQLVSDHPDSPFVATLAEVFDAGGRAPAMASPTALMTLSEHPALAPYVKRKHLQELQQALREEAATEQGALVAHLADRLLAKGMIDDDEVDALRADLATPHRGGTP